MKTTTLGLLATLLLSLPAAAATPEGKEARKEEARDRAQKRMRTMMLVGLAEALDLSDADALKMRDAMERFDQRRAPLRKEVAESAKVIKAAAGGDTGAQGQVDQAVMRAFDARAQMAQIDRELYQELSKGLSPERKAKLAIFLARFRDQAREVMREAKGMRHPGKHRMMRPQGQ